MARKYVPRTPPSHTCAHCKETFTEFLQTGRRRLKDYDNPLCTTCRMSVMWCWTCDQLLPLTSFHVASGNKNGRQGPCIPCRRTRQLSRTFDERLLVTVRRMGISVDQWWERFNLQQGRCAICDTEFGSSTPHVDHDHKCCPPKSSSCGKCIRGLLCTQCNTALGLMKDDPARLVSAVNYLERVGVN